MVILDPIKLTIKINANWKVLPPFRANLFGMALADMALCLQY